MTLASCIMPTRGRQALALKAVQCFKTQTYENRELIVLDDVDARSFPKGLRGHNIIYDCLPFRLSIAEKRNRCCQLARGEVICHWDSDDWSAPRRIEDQIFILNAGLVSVVGYNSVTFFDERTNQGYRFDRERRYAIGTSLCYLKSFWERNPFREGSEGKPWGEDNAFVWDALQRHEIDTWDGHEMIVARMHNDMTCPKDIRLGGEPSCGSWRALPVEAIPRNFFK